jgi:hypothetical protein
MAKTFGFESTADEVLEGVDLSGKRVLITGVSAGLGVETARAVVVHDGTVVGTARDLQKARRALTVALPPGASVELIEADLASLSSVRKATTELLAQGKPFDVIIANAGVMACPQGKTTDGFETQFGTNHLGHFVLVNKLVPLLKSDGRIVTLSSAGHQISDVNLDDPNFERTGLAVAGVTRRRLDSCKTELGDPQEIVGRADQVGSEPGSLHATIARAPEVADRLDPTEDLFDPFLGVNQSQHRALWPIKSPHLTPPPQPHSPLSTIPTNFDRSIPSVKYFSTAC